MNTTPEIDPELKQMLQELQPSPPREAHDAARAREAFLTEASEIAPRVPIPVPDRLNKWQESLGAFRLRPGREKRSMFNFVMAVVLALAVVLGGGATTVAVAQDAQPSDPLYAVKTWSEDLRLGLQSDPDAELNLALQFAARRTEEVRNLLGAGKVVPPALMTRFQNQLQQQLMVAAGLPGDEAIPALERVRNQAREQEQVMAQLQVRTTESVQTRARVQTMLQIQAQIAQEGIEDPSWLRTQEHLRQGGQVSVPTTLPAGPASAETTTGGGNPWTTGTPTPGSSYGPGESQNPWTTGTPIPGSSYGPGECDVCTGEPYNGSPGGQSGPGAGGVNAP